jgi:hypothetical protein
MLRDNKHSNPQTSSIHDAECGDKNTDNFWNNADAGNTITLEVNI